MSTSISPSPESKSSRRSVLTWIGAFAGSAAALAAGWRLALGRRHQPGQAASATPPVPASPAAPEPLPVVDTPLRHEVFAPLVNQPFQIGDRALVCELVEVSSVQRATTFKGSFATFSLLFAAPPSSLSNDGEIQKVEHTTAGQFEMFLAPVGKPGGRKQLLQAVCSARTA